MEGESVQARWMKSVAAADAIPDITLPDITLPNITLPKIPGS